MNSQFYANKFKQRGKPRSLSPAQPNSTSKHKQTPDSPTTRKNKTDPADVFKFKNISNAPTPL